MDWCANILAGSAVGEAAIWVRINPIDHAEAGADLSAVMPARPDGIMLPKTRSPDDVDTAGPAIGTYEAEHEIQVGSTRILPVATETPEALFSHWVTTSQCNKRLAGLTWGAEDLSAAVGAISSRDRERQLDRALPAGAQLCACSPPMPPASQP